MNQKNSPKTYRCGNCQQDKTEREFGKRRDRNNQALCTICRLCRSAWYRTKSQELRSKVIARYGGCCKECGFSDKRALQLDHIHSGGTHENRTIGNMKVYRLALEDQSGRYQILCANCNWIKRYEKQEMFRITKPKSDVKAAHRVDVLKAVRLFAAGIPIDEMLQELRTNRAVLVDALRKGSEILKLNWVEVALVRRDAVRKNKLQLGQHKKIQHRAWRMLTWIAERVAHHDAELKAQQEMGQTVK